MFVIQGFNRQLLINASIVLIFAALCANIGASAQQPPATATPPAAQQPPAATPPAGQQPPAGGRAGGGGGRGNPTASLFATTCAPCHGTDLAGGRAPSLFAERLLASNDDNTLAAKIRDGVPNTAMVPFKGTLDDQQIWQIVAYLRTEAANLKDKPVFVPDPNNQVIKSEKQTFRIEVVTPGLETPWGIAFLPDGRMLVTERPGRLRIIDKGKLLDAVQGTPKVWERQDSGMLDVAVHPQYAKNGWIYLAYTEPVPGYVAPPPQPPAPAPDPAAAASRTRKGRTWRAAEPALDDGLRPRQDRQGQSLGRGAAHLSRAIRVVHAERLALRHALPLRQERARLLQPGRARRHDQRAGSVQAARQDPSRQRRRVDSQGQPVRQHAECAAVDLELRASQPAGAGVGSERPAVGIRTRSDRRRRDQHHREGQELRLGRHLRWASRTASPSAAAKAWSSRSSTTRRRSRRAASGSTPARSIRAGRTISSSPRWRGSSCAGSRSADER